jgi:hypothetical protein
MSAEPSTSAAGGLGASSASLLDRSPPRWMLLALLCLALLVRGRVMLANSDSLMKDPDAYGDAAWHIAREGTLGLWQQERMLPTAGRAPLYPVVLSVFDLLPVPIDPFGYGCLHVVLGVATAWCVWRIGLGCGLPPVAALLAAGLVTIDPILLGQSVQLMSETLATFLVALALMLLVATQKSPSLPRSAGIGVLLGLAILCRPALIVWCLLVAAAFCWRAARSHAWAQTGLLLGLLALTVAPWVVRNAHVFGRAIVTTTHGGYTLLLGNNQEYYNFLREGGWNGTWDAKDVYAAWRERQTLIETPVGVVADEAAADRWAYEQAWSNIAEDPAGFLLASVHRLARFWGLMPRQTTPEETEQRHTMRVVIGAWYALVFALAAVGAWFWRKELLQAPLLWSTLLVLSLMAIHTVYWTDMRMRAPLAIPLSLAAAHAVSMLAARYRAANKAAAVT